MLCETLRYPGGCASTFTRNGYRFEAGATLSSGLGEGQLFSEWNRKWELGVRFETLDPLVELRTGNWSLAIHPERELPPDEQGEYIEQVQDRMRDTIRRRAPRLLEGARFEMTASPRTFERFTGRHHGYVGGVPRRVGLRHYRPRALWPREAGRSLYLVGDSVLLGQSTLAVALGGVKTAELIAKRDT